MLHDHDLVVMVGMPFAMHAIFGPRAVVVMMAVALAHDVSRARDGRGGDGDQARAAMAYPSSSCVLSSQFARIELPLIVIVP